MITGKNNVTVTFTVTDDKGKELPAFTSNSQYNGLDYAEVLFIEKELLGAFQNMNRLATEMTPIAPKK